jgi:hypothetical protein
MKLHPRSHRPGWIALTLAVVSLSAQAQSASVNPPDTSLQTAQAGSGGMGGGRAAYSSSGGSDAYSLLPYTRHGYVGLNLGKPEFKNDCGTGLYTCDDPSVSGYLYTGGLFNDWFGAEIGYLNTGSADRAGGRTRAQGLNLSLVARAPVGMGFNLFAKGGGLYGETRVTSGLLSNVVAGKERGWGGSYGVGVGYDFLPNSGVVLEWNRYQFNFPGGGDREDVETASLGYVYRF